MSNAIVLYKAPEAEKWTRIRTVEFNTRRTSIETVQLGSHEVVLQHAVQAGHYLLLTDGDTRLMLAPTGGNEPDKNAPKSEFDDIPVVAHHDIEEEGKTFRIYHASKEILS